MLIQDMFSHLVNVLKMPRQKKHKDRKACQELRCIMQNTLLQQSTSRACKQMHRGSGNTAMNSSRHITFPEELTQPIL